MLCPRALTKISRTLSTCMKTQTRNSLQNVFNTFWKSKLSQVFYSVSTRGVSLHELKSRGLVELSGKDTINFLQGLVTSDVSELEGDVSAQYSMMLNVQGRVLYDLLLYSLPPRTSSEKRVLIECDHSVMDEMIKIIRRYKIRKKVEICAVSEEWRLMAVLGGGGVPTGVEICVPDPRLPSFGWRLLQPGDKQDIKLDMADMEDEREYHKKRYEWGIPEGVLDLPPGNCFPLESNLVFHNGVSFQKGCYIGQELTARTHHTGVTRKRLMPLQFEREVDGSVEAGTNITREDGKNVGKFRHSVGQFGLGLMRVADLHGSLTVTDVTGDALSVTARIPPWWPRDVQS